MSLRKGLALLLVTAFSMTSILPASALTFVNFNTAAHSQNALPGNTAGTVNNTNGGFPVAERVRGTLEDATMFFGLSTSMTLGSFASLGVTAGVPVSVAGATNAALPFLSNLAGNDSVGYFCMHTGHTNGGVNAVKVRNNPNLDALSSQTALTSGNALANNGTSVSLIQGQVGGPPAGGFAVAQNVGESNIQFGKTVANPITGRGVAAWSTLAATNNATILVATDAFTLTLPDGSAFTITSIAAGAAANQWNLAGGTVQADWSALVTQILATPANYTFTSGPLNGQLITNFFTFEVSALGTLIVKAVPGAFATEAAVNGTWTTNTARITVPTGASGHFVVNRTGGVCYYLGGVAAAGTSNNIALNHSLFYETDPGAVGQTYSITQVANPSIGMPFNRIATVEVTTFNPAIAPGAAQLLATIEDTISDVVTTATTEQNQTGEVLGLFRGNTPIVTTETGKGQINRTLLGAGTLGSSGGAATINTLPTFQLAGTLQDTTGNGSGDTPTVAQSFLGSSYQAIGGSTFLPAVATVAATAVAQNAFLAFNTDTAFTGIGATLGVSGDPSITIDLESDNASVTPAFQTINVSFDPGDFGAANPNNTVPANIRGQWFNNAVVGAQAAAGAQATATLVPGQTAFGVLTDTTQNANGTDSGFNGQTNAQSTTPNALGITNYYVTGGGVAATSRNNLVFAVHLTANGRQLIVIPMGVGIPTGTLVQHLNFSTYRIGFTGAFPQGLNVDVRVSAKGNNLINDANGVKRVLATVSDLLDLTGNFDTFAHVATGVTAAGGGVNQNAIGIRRLKPVTTTTAGEEFENVANALTGNVDVITVPQLTARYLANTTKASLSTILAAETPAKQVATPAPVFASPTTNAANATVGIGNVNHSGHRFAVTVAERDTNSEFANLVGSAGGIFPAAGTDAAFTSLFRVKFKCANGSPVGVFAPTTLPQAGGHAPTFALIPSAGLSPTGTQGAATSTIVAVNTATQSVDINLHGAAADATTPDSFTLVSNHGIAAGSGCDKLQADVDFVQAGTTVANVAKDIDVTTVVGAASTPVTTAVSDNEAQFDFRIAQNDFEIFNTTLNNATTGLDLAALGNTNGSVSSVVGVIGAGGSVRIPRLEFIEKESNTNAFPVGRFSSTQAAASFGSATPTAGLGFRIFSDNVGLPVVTGATDRVRIGTLNLNDAADNTMALAAAAGAAVPALAAVGAGAVANGIGATVLGGPVNTEDPFFKRNVVAFLDAEVTVPAVGLAGVNAVDLFGYTVDGVAFPTVGGLGGTTWPAERAINTFVPQQTATGTTSGATISLPYPLVNLANTATPPFSAAPGVGLFGNAVVYNHLDDAAITDTTAVAGVANIALNVQGNVTTVTENKIPEITDAVKFVTAVDLLKLTQDNVSIDVLDDVTVTGRNGATIAGFSAVRVSTSNVTPGSKVIIEALPAGSSSPDMVAEVIVGDTGTASAVIAVATGGQIRVRSSAGGSGASNIGVTDSDSFVFNLEDTNVTFNITTAEVATFPTSGLDVADRGQSAVIARIVSDFTIVPAQLTIGGNPVISLGNDLFLATVDTSSAPQVAYTDDQITVAPVALAGFNTVNARGGSAATLRSNRLIASGRRAGRYLVRLEGLRRSQFSRRKIGRVGLTFVNKTTGQVSSFRTSQAVRGSSRRGRLTIRTRANVSTELTPGEYLLVVTTRRGVLTLEVTI